jgi:hypothetical protein
LQIIGRAWHHLYLPAVALLFAIGVAVAAAAAEQAESLLQAFEARYQQLLQQVEAGELSPQVEDEAKAIWLALRKDMIALNANIETLKLDVMSAQGVRQKALLDQLSQKAAEREHRVMQATQDLEQVAGGERAASPILPPRPVAPSSEETGLQGAIDKAGAEAEKPSEDTSTKTWDIEIEFAPEDLSKGEME